MQESDAGLPWQESLCCRLQLTVLVLVLDLLALLSLFDLVCVLKASTRAAARALGGGQGFAQVLSVAPPPPRFPGSRLQRGGVTTRQYYIIDKQSFLYLHNNFY